MYMYIIHTIRPTKAIPTSAIIMKQIIKKKKRSKILRLIHIQFMIIPCHQGRLSLDGFHVEQTNCLQGIWCSVEDVACIVGIQGDIMKGVEVGEGRCRSGSGKIWEKFDKNL